MKTTAQAATELMAALGLATKPGAPQNSEKIVR